MSVEIQTVTIGSEDDKRIVLTNGQLARVLPFTPSTWRWVRIAVLMSYVDTGANLTSSDYMYIGLMSNPDATVSNGPRTSACPHFVGARIGTTFTRNTSPYVYGSSYLKMAKRTGATVVTSSGGDTFVCPCTSSGRRAPLFLSIWKSGGDVSMGYNCCRAPSNYDIKPHQFRDLIGFRESAYITIQLAEMTEGSTPWIGSSTSLTTPIDEATHGAINSVVITWPYNTGFHVSEIAIQKYSSS
jgi:hypothetical protein